MAKKDARSVESTTKKSAALAATATATHSSGNSNANSIIKEIQNSISTAHKQYLKDLEDDQKLRLIDTFLAFLVVIGIFQFAFCILGGSYPFNAFLGGFSATVGQFVLTVGLRLQSNNSALFHNLLPERAFAEYIFASLILHFVIIHFIN